MKTLAKFLFSLSLLAGLIACDKDDNMGTLIVNVRDNAKVEELNIYTEGGSLIYTNTEYLYQNDPRLSIPLNPGNYQMQLMYGFNCCSLYCSTTALSRFGQATRPPSIMPTVASMER